MQIIWSKLASDSLLQIYNYHCQVAHKRVGRKIKSKIFNSTEYLLKYPKSGQIEQTLISLNEHHRYIVVDNYKVIYRKIIEGILITDIFDTRQDPSSTNKSNRLS